MKILRILSCLIFRIEFCIKYWEIHVVNVQCREERVRGWWNQSFGGYCTAQIPRSLHQSLSLPCAVINSKFLNFFSVPLSEFKFFFRHFSLRISSLTEAWLGGDVGGNLTGWDFYVV